MELYTGTFFTYSFSLAAADFSFFSPPLAAYGKKPKNAQFGTRLDPTLAVN